MKRPESRKRGLAMLAGALTSTAALMFVAVPAHAIGGSSQACTGGFAYGYSYKTSTNKTVASDCKATTHARVRSHYTVSGGTSYTTSWAVSGTYVTTASQSNPGYPVFQGDHSYETATSTWYPDFSE